MPGRGSMSCPCFSGTLDLIESWDLGWVWLLRQGGSSGPWCLNLVHLCWRGVGIPSQPLPVQQPGKEAGSLQLSLEIAGQMCGPQCQGPPLVACLGCWGGPGEASQALQETPRR